MLLLCKECNFTLLVARVWSYWCLNMLDPICKHTHDYMREKRNREKGLILMTQILPIVGPTQPLNLNICRYKYSEAHRTSQALLCLSTRPSHSLDNLHRPVHSCGVVIDKKWFGHPQLWIKTFKNQYRVSHRCNRTHTTSKKMQHTLALISRKFRILFQQLIEATGESWKCENGSVFPLLPAVTFISIFMACIHKCCYCSYHTCKHICSYSYTHFINSFHVFCLSSTLSTPDSYCLDLFFISLPSVHVLLLP